MIELSTKTKVILVSAGLIISFASGRYSVSKPEISTNTKADTTLQQEVDKQLNTQTVIVYEKAKDGTEKTTETITDLSREETVAKEKESEAQVTTVTPPKNNQYRVDVLAGIGITNPYPVYGASVSKQFIGPISLGAWGLSNGTVGLSIGVSF